jgi:hypothetical protein
MKEDKIDGVRIINSIFEKYENESWVLSWEQIRKKSDSIKLFSKNKWEYLSDEFRGPITIHKDGRVTNRDRYEVPKYGLNSGVVVQGSIIRFLIDNGRPVYFSLQGITENELNKYLVVNSDNTITISDRFNPGGVSMGLIKEEVTFLKEFLNVFTKEVRKKKEEEEIRLKSLNQTQSKLLQDLDKDGNGIVDSIEGGEEFNLLLKKHQKKIIEIDRTYVQQFVKVSSYLKTKKGNIQSIFNSIKDTPNQVVLNEYVEILKDDIHTYNLILFNSLKMIVSLVEDDMITFYEIHEMFDTLNMFDSKHEKDVSQKLTNIGDRLGDLMYEVRRMGNKISNSIQQLSYVTEQSNEQLSNQLSKIDSTLKVGNLISVINTYQNYKINKKTKSLRG